MSEKLCEECGVNPRWVENQSYPETHFCKKCNIDMYNQHLDELSIEDVNLTTSIALEKCDPTAYEIGFNLYVESEQFIEVYVNKRKNRSVGEGGDRSEDSPLDG